MADPVRFPGSVHIVESLQCGSFTGPAGFLRNEQVNAAAAIGAEKLVHMVNAEAELFGPTTSIAALTKLIHIGKGAGTIAAFRAFIVTVATGADRTVTVDLQKSTAGGAFATVLSGTVGFTNGSTALTLVSGTLSSTTYVASDLFRVVVTVAGSASAQALGLHASMIAYEATT